MTIKLNKKNIKPYGDTLNDGKIQFSFTMPVPANPRGKEAATLLLKKMGISEIDLCYYKDIGEGFTHFIAYGSTSVSIDLTKINVKMVETPVMSMKEIDKYISDNIGKKITIVGACIESDAHTVGIDAIMNMKGYNMHYGLERYKSFNAHNLGAQVPSEELLKQVKELDAEVVLISQVVTQKNIHIKNLTKLIELAEIEGLREGRIFICGGPRISHELAIELGYNAGFGSGSYANDVASFIAFHLNNKNK